MPEQQKINVFWFRRDLRLHDNRGLFHALKGGLPVLPLFIFDSSILNNLVDKKDSRVTFIYDEVCALRQKPETDGSTLLIKHGMVNEIFTDLKISRQKAIEHFKKHLNG